MARERIWTVSAWFTIMWKTEYVSFFSNSNDCITWLERKMLSHLAIYGIHNHKECLCDCTRKVMHLIWKYAVLTYCGYWLTIIWLQMYIVIALKIINNLVSIVVNIYIIILYRPRTYFSKITQSSLRPRLFWLFTTLCAQAQKAVAFTGAIISSYHVGMI